MKDMRSYLEIRYSETEKEIRFIELMKDEIGETVSFQEIARFKNPSEVVKARNILRYTWQQFDEVEFKKTLGKLDDPDATYKTIGEASENILTRYDALLKKDEEKEKFTSKEEMALFLLIGELFSSTGHNFYKDGTLQENINWEVIHKILEEEATKEKFYEAILDILAEEIKKYCGEEE